MTESSRHGKGIIITVILNTQLSYTHFYKANHLEEGESFLDFLWAQKDAARQFAEKFYQTKGICLPGVTVTIDGKPLGGMADVFVVTDPPDLAGASHSIYIIDMPAIAQILRATGMDLFSGNRTVYPRTFTIVRSRGLRTSGVREALRQIHDDEAEAWLTPNSHYDLALLRCLYQTFDPICRRTGRVSQKRVGRDSFSSF